jgi:hypothetical protein
MQERQAVQTEKMRLIMPVHDWVLCAVVREDIVSPGGLHLPTQTGVAGSNVEEFVVLAAGPASMSGLQPNDRIKFVGKAPTFSCDGRDYLQVRDAQPGIWPVERANIGDRIEMLPTGQPFITCIIRADPTPEQPARELQ